MAKLLFSTWQGEFIDNRGKSPDEWSESGFKLPETYHGERNSKAFIGWDGVAIFDEDIDAVELASKYASEYQEYSEALEGVPLGDGEVKSYMIYSTR